MLLIDGHLDLSMNALEWNRDLTRPLAEIRRREAGKTDKKDRGRGVCTFEEMRRGEIGLCIATQIARYVAEDNPLPGWNAPEIAWAQTQGQLAWYPSHSQHLVLKLRYGFGHQNSPGMAALGSVPLVISTPGNTQIATVQGNLAF